MRSVLFSLTGSWRSVIQASSICRLSASRAARLLGRAAAITADTTLQLSTSHGQPVGRAVQLLQLPTLYLYYNGRPRPPGAGKRHCCAVGLQCSYRASTSSELHAGWHA